jgi:P-type Ca2+ transporter type 2C
MPHRSIPADRLGDLMLSERGLTAEELSARRSRFGFNDIVETPPASWRDLVRDTARDPMIWFLLGTSLLFALLGEYTEALILLVALAPLAGMDAYLHRRTQASTQGLASRLAARAKVLRDGATTEVPARDLVPGDLVLLAPDELFPADGLVVAGADLQADESALTGEAYPVRKQPFDPKVSAKGGTDERHWAFAGTRLLTGQARLRVTHIGGETLYGEIVRSALAGAHARTPLQTAVGGLVAILLTAALIVCVTLAAIRLLQGHGLLDAFLSAVTLAVAALPEEFPVVFTFFLGVGVYRLARRQALVRRAVAVENIGRVTCICSDKTGTLTEGRLVLAHQEPVPGGSAERLVRLAALAARSDSGDPLDRALIDAAGPSDFVRLATFPFTEDRRRETAVARGPDGHCLAVVKGAPETVLRMCRLEEAEAARWRRKIEGFASTGHKVIACAAQPLDEANWPGGEPDRGYSLHGILAFEDQVRPGVKEAVQACQTAGIRVVMVTGDHPATAEAIAREIGMGGAAPVVVMGQETQDERESPRAARWEGVDVIARAIPSQKLELVRALQAAGEIVAVTGDGVNDVPALQAADIGIAMGERGTRSAREVAAIVLLDDNFRTIVRAIAEGRQLFRNLQLSFAYLLMVHIPLVLSAAIIPLAGYPLLYLPVHIVWLELIIHPTALLVFQELPTTAELMPAERNGKPRFFSIGSWLAIGTVGAMITAVVVFGYDFALGAGGDVEHARAMALVALIVAGAIITATLSMLSSWTARVVILASLASLGLLVQIPALAALVHLRPLHLDDWALAVAGGAGAGILSGLVGLTIRKPRRRSPRLARNP